MIYFKNGENPNNFGDIWESIPHTESSCSVLIYEEGLSLTRSWKTCPFLNKNERGIDCGMDKKRIWGGTGRRGGRKLWP